MRFVSGHCWAFKILTSLPDGFNNFLAKFAGSVQILFANSRVKGLNNIIIQSTSLKNFYKIRMDDIPYSRIRVIYVLRPCAVGFALRSVRDIFLRKWPLVVFNIFVACYNFKTAV